MTMKTRFAPSPTGDLHIGGARTALFNFLAAKHAGGKFLLRIEDTDKERNSETSLNSIIDGLNWLGLTHDGEIVHQSEQTLSHDKAAQTMVGNDTAYLCWTTQEELTAQRLAAENEKRAFKYDRRYRPKETLDDNGVRQIIGAGGDIPEEDRYRIYFELSNSPSCIRIKVPLDGVTEFDDIVRGKLSINNSELDDFVILRTDGTPTYLLAVVVDDHNAGVTHVIRGEDHITNTFKQIQIYKALGWNVPKFAHIPLIHGEDGKKLSKRDGAASLLALRDAGYLPEAVCSYLVGLGWGHATNYMTMEEMIAKFDINQVGSSPSRLDQKKLDNINYHFMQKMDDAVIVRKIMINYMNGHDNAELIKNIDKIDVWTTRIRFMTPQLKERAKTLVELYKSAEFLFELPDYDDSAKSILASHIGIIQQFLPYYVIGGDFHSFAIKYEFKLKDVATALRATLCGSKTSSGSMDSIIEALGDEEVIFRMREAIDEFTPMAI